MSYKKITFILLVALGTVVLTALIGSDSLLVGGVVLLFTAPLLFKSSPTKSIETPLYTLP